MTKLERICFCIVVSSLVPIATHAQITAKTAEGAPFSGNPLQAETMVKIAREEFDEMLTSETPLVVRVVLRVLDD